MPKTLTITKSLGATVVSPTIRWPSGSRMAEGDKAAVAAYTKEVELVFRSLLEAVRELQLKLDGGTV